MARSLLLWFALLPFLGSSTAGCSSTPKAPATSDAARVTLRDARGGPVLSIVNDSLLLEQGVAGADAIQRRATYASEVRASATTKVAEDELVAGLIQGLEQQGFARFSRDGSEVQPKASILEIESGGRRRVFAGREGMSGEEATAYITCKALFVDVYNRIPFYQAAHESQINLEPVGPRR